MRHRSTMLLTLALALLLGWSHAAVAQSVKVVEWADDQGAIQPNTLFDAIDEDLDEDGNFVGPDDRVYQLQANGLYWVDATIVADFPLRLVGEEVGEGDVPPVLQLIRDDAGDAVETLIEANDDLELRNLWILGRTDFGDEGWGQIDLVGANSTVVIDNIVLEYNFSALIHILNPGIDFSVTNSHFRNIIDHNQYWAGRMVRLESPAKRVFVENNTFFNIGHTVVQVQHPVDELWFNHNTVVNTGREVVQYEHVQMQTAYIANNLLINGFWHGETDENFSPTRIGEEDNQYGQWFNLDYLDPALGLEDNRRIGFLNNVQWVHPDIWNYYDEYPDDIGPDAGAPAPGDVRAGDFLDQRGKDIVNMLDGVKWENHLNLVGEDLGLQFHTDGHFDDLAADMLSWLTAFRAGDAPGQYYWDMPGRDVSPGELLPSVWDVYPLAENAENFTYTHSEALSHAFGGYPVGDLNWYPDQKADWEGERDNLAQEIYDQFDPPLETEVYGFLEADEATLVGDASLEMFDGFGWFTWGDGTVEWEFELDDAGQYDLELLVHLENGGMRALNLFVNDTEIHDLKGWGEYVFDTDDGVHAGIAIDEWEWALIEQDGIVEDDALTLNEGTNTFRIETGWGEISAASLNVLPAGSNDPVLELTAEDATYSGFSPRGAAVMGEDELAFVPRKFQSIHVEDGSASWNLELDNDAVFLMMLFYQSESGDQTATLSINEDVVADGITLAAPDAGQQSFASDFLNLEAGSNTFEVSSSSGDLNMEYVQIFEIMEFPTDTEHMELADGFELRQNYPNPFNPTTQIQYTIPEAADVRLEVYNLIGQRVAVLTDSFQSSGTHTVQFDGQSLASGVYIYRLQAGTYTEVRKMTLIK